MPLLQIMKVNKLKYYLSLCTMECTSVQIMKFIKLKYYQSLGTMECTIIVDIFL